jgi:hypothetical protein
MEDLIKRGGYTFKSIKSINAQRPYRVRCLETGATSDSALSYEDAVAFIIGTINFAEATLDSNSKDITYVEKVFSERLLGKKKSICDEIVNEIIDRQIIKGDIWKVPEKEKYERKVEYLTEQFSVDVLFEHGLFSGATKIIVNKRNK